MWCWWLVTPYPCPHTLDGEALLSVVGQRVAGGIQFEGFSLGVQKRSILVPKTSNIHKQVHCVIEAKVVCWVEY